jgi:hypothetical protein
LVILLSESAAQGRGQIMNNDTSKKLGTLVSDDGPVNVYVWDMDETLILLRSLLNGTYAESFNGSKDVKRGVEIGRMWEKHILKICDDFFFYEQVSLLLTISSERE